MTKLIGGMGLTACLALAAVALAGGAVGPAHADGRDHGREQDHDGWRRRPEREEYRRPDVYYSAPPVVIVPQRYYAPPGAHLSIDIPFFR